LINFTLIFVLCFAFGFLGLHRASAQLGPPPAPMVPSGVAVPTPNGTSTKIVRIYNGAGHFDDALAEKLRPMLAKAFPFARPEPPKAAPGATVSAPVKSDAQKKLAEAAH
jgi:hypothetical protein